MAGLRRRDCRVLDFEMARELAGPVRDSAVCIADDAIEELREAAAALAEDDLSGTAAAFRRSADELSRRLAAITGMRTR